MGSVVHLGKLLECSALIAYSDPKDHFLRRDEIKQILADHLHTRTTQSWLSVLEPQDVWCADVLTWPELFDQEAFRALDMVQEITRAGNISLLTTRCPIRIDGTVLKSSKGAPRLGDDTENIRREFALSAGA